MKVATLTMTALVAVAGVATPAGAEILELSKRVSGTTVHYKVVLPVGYDPDRAYPAVLVFGGGPQTMRTVDGTLARNFRDEAEKRGYIVIAPAAPDDDLFFRDGARIFPRFLQMMLSDYSIRHEKFHVAGPSNGGIAAYHIAAENPEYFLSVTAFPGYLWQPSSEKLRAISGMCAYFYIGEHDEYRWHDEMRREAEFLTDLGTLARYTVEAGQGHRLNTLAEAGSGRLFDDFAASEAGCRTAANTRE
jgi:poly(3-hydroxybutyrate) depolymerase